MTLKKQLRKILKGLNGEKILSIIECQGPIYCISIELETMYLDISQGDYQLVAKTEAIVKARKLQLKNNKYWHPLLNKAIYA